MTKNTVSKAIGIIMVASLLIAIVAQALYPIQIAAQTNSGNRLLYDPFEDGTTLGVVYGEVSFEPSGNNGQGFDMGQSVYFDGEGGDYISYDAGSQLGTNQGTLELWVRRDSWLTTAIREDILITSTATDLGIHLELRGWTGQPADSKSTLQLWSQSYITQVVVYDAEENLGPGWHHFAIAWNNDKTILYIDGLKIGQRYGNTPEHNTLRLSSEGERLTGYIDEFASYDYMKTGDQIWQDFEAQSSPHTTEPPVADANGPYTGDEGSLIDFDGSGSHDPDGAIESINWDFGDGDVVSDNLSPSHAYQDNDVYTVTLTIIDDDGLEATDTTTVTVSNVDPTVEAGEDQEVNQGDMVSLIGSFTDPGTADTHTAVWDWDDGTSPGIVTQAVVPVNGSHTYTAAGIYDVTLTVTDKDGGVGESATLQVTVVAMPDQAPTADANGPYTGDEGSPITFYGSSPSDPDGTIFDYDWDLDGVGQFDDKTGATVSYTWDDDYAGDIGLKVTDNGLSGTTTTTVTVLNVAPTVVVAGADQEVNQGDMVSLTGSFTDLAGADDAPYTAEWDWDDGTPTDIVNQAVVPVNGSHTYTTAGIYDVTLKVTDKDGGVGESATLQVTVIDMPDGTRAMLEFQIERAKIEVSKGKVSVKGTFELDPGGGGADISEEIVVIMGPLSETIPGGTMVEMDKNGNWEYKRPIDDEGIIKKMKIDWTKGKFEFSMDNADLSELTDPDNVTISIQIGDDFGQTTIMMEITYGYSMPR